MFIINPGTEDTRDLGFQQAYSNIMKFIEDCEIPLFMQKANGTPEVNGRYLFTLGTQLKRDLQWEVEMPSLPLDQVRYIDKEKQNILDFPRLYVDGSSWVWMFATIKKEGIIEHLETEISDYEALIEDDKELIKKLTESKKS